MFLRAVNIYGVVNSLNDPRGTVMRYCTSICSRLKNERVKKHKEFLQNLKTKPKKPVEFTVHVVGKGKAEPLKSLFVSAG